MPWLGRLQSGMTGRRPDTPPRYRYVRSGTSDDEQDCNGDSSKVLAARRRAGSLGRPVQISRRLDRQRHGGTALIEGKPAAPALHALQAPALLKLGQLGLDAPPSFETFLPAPRPSEKMLGMEVSNPPYCHLGSDPVASAIPAFARPSPGKPVFQRSQSVGRNVQRESAFLRPPVGTVGTLLGHLQMPVVPFGLPPPFGHTMAAPLAPAAPASHSCPFPPSQTFANSLPVSGSLAECHQADAELRTQSHLRPPPLQMTPQTHLPTGHDCQQKIQHVTSNPQTHAFAQGVFPTSTALHLEQSPWHRDQLVPEPEQVTTQKYRETREPQAG